MSEPFVTALVLLDRTSTRASARCTFRAARGQSRIPDRTVVVLPDDAADDLRDEIARSSEAAQIIQVAGGRSPAATIAAALALLAPPREAAGESAEGASRSARAGRRARAIDREDRERRLAAEAESLAQVPVRLREAEPRAGRRMSRTAGAGEEWLWFVPDASAPGTACLESLLRTVAESPRTAVVGAKRLLERGPAPAEHAEAEAERADAAAERADAPADQREESALRAGEENESCGPTADDVVGLLDMGLTLTHGGRITTGVEPGEIDQGQVDWREDVLAVALPGMLVRGATLRRLGGLDPDLPGPWAEIDLCRRVWRSGERVAVQSEARVLAHRSALPDHVRLREHRRGQMLALLKQRSGPSALLLLLALPVMTALRALIALLASQPRAAGAEIQAWLGAMRRAGAVMARGLAARRTNRVPQGRLAPLYVPRGEDLRQRLESGWTRLFADDERTRRERMTSWGIAGTRHGIEDADYGRHLVWSLVLALSATVLGLVALRSVFGRGDLVGPGLVPLPRAWADAAAAGWSTWVPGGLGSRGPADPLLRLLGSVPLPGELLVEAILFTAIPISALTAWWAAGALTRAIGARLVLASLWALAPSLLAAIAVGAWPLLLVHMLLPSFALALAQAIGLRHKVHRARPSAAALGGLALLVIGAVQPVLVILLAVALAVVAPLVPGRRRRLLWFLAPSLALHGPYIPDYIAHPRSLLSVGAVGSTGPDPSLLDLLALWPVAAPRDAIAAAIGAPAAQALLLIPVLLLLPAALASTLLAGPAGRAGRAGIVIAGLAGGVVLVALRVPTEVVDHELRAAPLHALLGVAMLGLGTSAACMFDALARRDEHVHGLRRRLSALVAVVAAAGTAALVLAWSLQLPPMLRIDRQTGAEVPAAAADLGRSEARGRVLVLEPDPAEDSTASARLLVQGEDSAAQRASMVSARLAEAPRTAESDTASAALREATAQLLTRGSDEAEPSLRTLAVGYIVVPGAPSERAALVDALDASPLLEKVTQNAGGSLWRVVDAGARVQLRTDAGASTIASETIEASGDLRPARAKRLLVLSERAESGWRASVDGKELRPTTVDGWAQGFEVPAGAQGQLELHREQPWTPLWKALLAVAVALTAAMSIPWRARTRSREVLYG